MLDSDEDSVPEVNEYLNLSLFNHLMSDLKLVTSTTSAFKPLLQTLTELKDGCDPDYLQSRAFKDHVEECRKSLKLENCMAKIRDFGLQLSEHKLEPGAAALPPYKRRKLDPPRSVGSPITDLLQVISVDQGSPGNLNPVEANQACLNKLAKQMRKCPSLSIDKRAVNRVPTEGIINLSGHFSRDRPPGNDNKSISKRSTVEWHNVKTTSIPVHNVSDNESPGRIIILSPSPPPPNCPKLSSTPNSNLPKHSSIPKSHPPEQNSNSEQSSGGPSSTSPNDTLVNLSKIKEPSSTSPNDILANLSKIEARFPDDHDVLEVIKILSSEISRMNLAESSSAVDKYCKILVKLKSAYSILFHLLRLLKMKYFAEVNPVHITPDTWFSAVSFPLADFVMVSLFKRLLHRVLPESRKPTIELFGKKFSR